MIGTGIGISSSWPGVNRLASAQGLLAGSMERLATGKRINHGSDDPAGLIAAMNLDAALASLDAESRSMDRADAVANTADGAMAEISDLLSDANAYTVANANTAGMSQAERDANQMMVDSSLQSIDRIASTTTFNGDRLLDGSATIGYGIGDRAASLPIGSAATSDLGSIYTQTGGSYSLSDAAAGKALDTRRDPAGAQQSIGSASAQIATMRGAIGSFQKYTIDSDRASNAAAFENTSAALSVIRDTDYAAETGYFSRAGALYGAAAMALTASNRAQGSLLDLFA